MKIQMRKYIFGVMAAGAAGVLAVACAKASASDLESRDYADLVNPLMGSAPVGNEFLDSADRPYG